MNTRRIFVVALVIALGMALVLFRDRAFQPPSPPSPLPIVIARLKAPHSGLIHLAEARGYFVEEGLAVAMKTTLTGYEAIMEVLNGEADVATAAETPIARALAEGKQPKVLATIFSSQWNSGIVARKDRGITQPANLKGKRIGFVFGTATHYLLETFLAFHNIPLETVTLVPGKPDDVVRALVVGDVDAASIWTPYLTKMQEALGDKAVTFLPQEFYSELTNLVVRPDYVARQRETTDRLMRALFKAESFAKAHPEEAVAIIAAASGAAPAAIRGPGGSLTHELTLKQSLLLATENEVRWYFRRGMVPAGPFPDVLQAFETEPLRAIKPEGVTISK